MKQKFLLALSAAGAAALFMLHDADKPAGNYAKIATLPDGKLYQNMDTSDVVFVAPGRDAPAFVRNVPLERGWKVATVEGEIVHWVNVGTGAEHGQRYDWTMSGPAISAEGYA